MEVSIAALAAALLLAAVYAVRGAAGEDRLAERFWHRRRWMSLASGVSVAYVFVDVLPELAAQGEVLREAVGPAGLFGGEQRIYLFALVAFVVLYGLDHLVLSAREQRRERLEEERGDALYWLHLGGFAAYSALIGYLLVERAERGNEALAFYAVAMTLHFVIVNHSMLEEHGAVYRRSGHWWLAIAVLAGFLVATLSPLSEAMFARLFAVLAGGVVITSLRNELPEERTGRFWPFCIGALLFAALLLLA
jgi:hypothetical protein